MNLRLVELEISDFKGVSGTHNIDLQAQVIFFNGANGYGKTTIYDALELALTGTIARIQNAKTYEDGHKRHKGSLLHNNHDKDISIKLALEKNGVRKTISVKYPKSDSTQPLIDWDKFQFSLISEDGEIEGGKETIVEWLGIIANGYRLFTYLQQSDSTFFLKQPQKNRHTMLNPLLDSSGKYNQEVASIESLRKRLVGFGNHIETKLKSFDDNSVHDHKQNVIHKRLIDGEIVQEFDYTNPFKDLEIEAAKAKYTQINDKLDEINIFLEQFQPSEYLKNEKHRYLSRFAGDRAFLDYTVLQNVINNEELYDKALSRLEVSELSKEPETLAKYYLQNLLEEEAYLKLKLNAESYLTQEEALYEDDQYRKTEDLLTNLVDPEFGFTAETRAKATHYKQQYDPLVSAVDTYEELIAEFEDARNELQSKFIEVTSKHNALKHSDGECPFCGTDWKSKDELVKSFETKSQSLNKLMDTATKQKNTLEKTILRDLITPLAEALKLKSGSSKLYNFLIDYGQLELRDIEANNLLSNVLPAAKKLIAKDATVNSEELQKGIRQLRLLITEHVNTDEIKVITRIQEVQKNDYSNYFEVLKKLSIEFLEQNLLPQDSLPSYEKLEKASDNIRLKLAQSAQEIVVKPEATLPEHVRLYTTLFSSKAELLDTAKKDLPQKREYIAQQFSTVYLGAKRVLEQKQVQIQLLLEKVGTLKEKYNLAIRDFQQNLTKSLQLPFYVYSAKILQNTPQCQGVFMVTQSDSGTIVFTPERGATHDILGQLSSGQLVVVSMAFYLAMNTVFSDHRTGLMAIDDPVQDLDALNIHSLTELMRREFIGQYQVIMSTHNDQDVNYMRYKFSTAVGSENIRNINVQQLFFEANENPSI